MPLATANNCSSTPQAGAIAAPPCSVPLQLFAFFFFFFAPWTAGLQTTSLEGGGEAEAKAAVPVRRLAAAAIGGAA
ncbi:MAG: hypothetical protein ACKOZV_13955, partial [Bacteroidota bacterium]